VSARRTNSPPRRNDSNPRGGGSLFTGLFIGLVAGLVIAAGLAWYLSSRTPDFQTPESKPPVQPRIEEPEAVKATPEVKPSRAKEATNSASSPVNATETTKKIKPTPPQEPKKKISEPTVKETTGAIKPRVDYTFYGILPGDQPAKPIPLPDSKDIWWLQVAALKSPVDADKLKARLALLGLEVATQKVDSGSGPLYRVRVGPYKREDDALGDLDTLAENNFEPRLFKEPNPAVSNPVTKSSQPPTNKEKP
jgi:cell division protein FtsN